MAGENTESIKLWRILVPRGSKLTHHKAWDEKVKNISGGLSLNGVIKGQWKDCDEGMIQVEIACTLGQIKQIGQITKEHYEQEAVMIYKISDEVYFI